MTVFQLIADSTYTHKFVLQKIIWHLTGWTREELIVHYDEVLTIELLDRIKELYDLYAIHHEPLEYILWYVEYGWLRLQVNKHTIIPRPETEYMIEAVREFFSHQNNQSFILVDVWTWSGVLGLSIIHSHATQLRRAVLIDISPDALQVAMANYKDLLQQRKISSDLLVTCKEGNLFDIHAISPDKIDMQYPFVILANLPYIPDETFDTNPDRSISHEPRIAFVGGDDGLDLYRVMFAQVRESGLHCTMFLEMMTWQVDILRQEFEWLIFEEIKTFHFQIKIVKVIQQ